jgi:anti-sigma factor RsiW
MHTTRENMSAYIRNQLPDAGRAAFEEHLYGCQACLETYMEQLGEDQDVLPYLQDAESLTSRIMEQVVPRKRWFQSSFFHYGIAAAIMLVLTASGLFQGLSWEPEERNTASEERAVSYSERIMNQTITVIGQIKEKREAGHE